MKLLLTSNGLTSPEVKQAFWDLIGNRKGLSMGLIHTASDPINWVPSKEDPKKYVAVVAEDRVAKNKAWRDSYVKELTDDGFDVTLVDLTKDLKGVRDKLENVDVINVTGGDVNYLLDWAKKAGLDRYLKEMLDRGVVYFGSSAGCGLPMPDIGLTWWEPDTDVDRIGFGIVDFVIVPHQRENTEDRTTEKLVARKKHLQSIINFPWRVYLVQDGQAIKVDGDKVEHIGPGIKKSI
jgi:peptidase E